MVTDITDVTGMEDVLQKMSRVDLLRINGIRTNNAFKVIAEIGIDMSR